MADNQNIENKRYYLIDSIRGICIWGMIIYHTLFDVVMIFGTDYSILENNLLSCIRDIGASCFIIISGICYHFEKHRVKRVIMINAAGLIVSAATFVVMPEMPVIFGILTFYGMMSIMMIPLSKILKKIPPYVGLVFSLILFLLFFSCFYGYCGFYGKIIFRFPEVLYKNYFTAFLGFPFYDFMSSDYYPLLPWCFAYFAGYYIWIVTEKYKDSLKLLYLKVPVAAKTGKYSLYIYLIHQPVVYAVVYLIYFVIIHKTS